MALNFPTLELLLIASPNLTKNPNLSIQIEEHRKQLNEITSKAEIDVLNLIVALLNGKYEEVANLEFATELFSKETTTISFQAKDLNHFFDQYELHLTTVITNYLDSESGKIDCKAISILGLGIAILNLFIQIGWTGPESKITAIQFLPSHLKENISQTDFDKALITKLSNDGEDFYHLTPQPGLLWLSKVVLGALHKQRCSSIGLISSAWWLARSIFVHDRILDNPTGSHQDRISSLMEECQSLLPNDNNFSVGNIVSLTSFQVRDVRTRFFIEKGLHSHHFYQDREAVKSYTVAQQNSGLQWRLTGALGKRTKFQQRDHTQLVLWARSFKDDDAAQTSRKSTAIDPAGSSSVPKTLDLNDDTLLEKIKFSDAYSNGEPTEDDIINPKPLNVSDQCLLLAHCLNVKNTNPSHGLTIEEMLPYVARVLEHPLNWLVHTMGLMLRSRLESHKSRTVERSVFQLQALVDQCATHDSPVSERMEHFYSLLLPSRWEMKAELAKRFMSLGVIRSALEIYKELELFEELTTCHQMLEEKEKALAVVDNQLSLNPTSPKLLCLKGDVLADPSFWHQAWEASNNRFPRAMRALGSYHFSRGEYKESYEFYLKALAINPLFENSWFICGCAALHCEQFAVAQRAFSKCTSLDPENGEAWNNLATIYMRTDRKEEALRALRQALRQNHGNWKMWTNLLYTSIDLGYFNDTIHAFTRIVDIRWEAEKEKCVDKEILAILVNAVVNDTSDANGQGASKCRNLLVQLIETTILSRIANDSSLWQLAAKFYAAERPINQAKVLECYLKAYRTASNHPDLLSNHEIFSTCATCALDLVDAYSNFGPQAGANGELVASDWKYQSKLLLRNLIARTRDSFETEPEHDLLVKALNELKAEG